MNNYISYLLNNYPYSASYSHKYNKYNKDWYPIAIKRFGFMACPYCKSYEGEKLDCNDKYKCNNCFTYFKICCDCKSYHVIKNVNKNNVMYKKNPIFSKIFESINLSLPIIKIIYNYSLFEYLYTNNERDVENSYCPRC